MILLEGLKETLFSLNGNIGDVLLRNGAWFIQTAYSNQSDKYFINNQSATYVIATVTKTNPFRFEHDDL